MNEQIKPTLTVEDGWDEAEIHNYRQQFNAECELPNSQPVSIFFWTGRDIKIGALILQAARAGHFVVVNPFCNYLSRAQRRRRGTLRITGEVNMTVVRVEASSKRRIVINEVSNSDGSA